MGEAGDITSRALLPEDARGRGEFRARQDGVMAGMAAVPILVGFFNECLQVDAHVSDGEAFVAGQPLGTVVGPLRAILAFERTALNLLQRLCAVATVTRQYVDAVAGHRACILDTRKTTPGFRLLEKYAVRAGGGRNHRVGLYDQVLIKDNHLAAMRVETPAEAVVEAVDRARQASPAGTLIQVEVDDLEQLAAALTTSADLVLLDNMTPGRLGEAVALRNDGPRAPEPALEASGGVTLASVAEIAATGVERISVGALTHSAGAIDIALDFDRVR